MNVDKKKWLPICYPPLEGFTPKFGVIRGSPPVRFRVDGVQDFLVDKANVWIAHHFQTFDAIWDAFATQKKWIIFNFYII